MKQKSGSKNSSHLIPSTNNHTMPTHTHTHITHTHTHTSQSHLLHTHSPTQAANFSEAKHTIRQRLKIDGVTSIELKAEKFLNKQRKSKLNL